MKFIPTVLLILLLGACAVKPAPMCIFCDQEIDGQIHTGHEVPVPTSEVTK